MEAQVETLQKNLEAAREGIGSQQMAACLSLPPAST